MDLIELGSLWISYLELRRASEMTFPGMPAKTRERTEIRT